MTQWKCKLGHIHELNIQPGLHIDESPHGYHEIYKSWCNICNPARTFIKGNEIECPNYTEEAGDMNT